ncbi:hypothetical protein LVJ94_07985 [Pendulispora rubella]|uniref:Uncharacterized protein n=1 Tax=Pendulispora rubella TaxID=2741070 RepID=A0ABZ2L8B8_9BACT
MPTRGALPLLLSTALLSASVASTGTLHAAPTPSTKDACIDGADEGQSLRDEGKLRDARARFLSCANSSCPGAIAKDCGTWLADVESRMPTVVVTAINAAGNDLVDVRVSVDGQPFLERLSGTEVTIDPGPHRLRYEYTGVPSMPPVEDNIVIYERQKGRALVAKFQSATTEPPLAPASDASPVSSPKRSAPIAAYVVGGVGLVALGSAAFFGLRGRSDYSDLDSTCGRTHSCAQSDIDAVKTKFTISDISLGLGVAAIGVAAVLYFTHPKEPAGPRSGGAPLLNHAVIAPTRGGGWLAGYETAF